MLFCGVEGGSSSTEVVIVSSTGELLSKIVGPHVNQWFLGYPEAVKRTLGLIEQALKAANLPTDTRLDAVGLALSGVDSEDNARDFEKNFMNSGQTLTKHVLACNDTFGTLYAATDKAGIVLIAGTGSICRYIREDLSYERVGGYGYMLGDESSGYWITHRCLKLFVDDDEGLVKCPYDTQKVRKAVFEHFKLRNNLDLLEPLYHFKKNEFSSLCKTFAELARDGDELCKHVFHEAGYYLGAHVMAVLQKTDKAVLENPEGVSVTCRGAVMKSWDLLEKGFADRVMPDLKAGKPIRRLRLFMLNSSVAAGAALLAAHVCLNLNVPRHPEQSLMAEFKG
ncbi:hypothetical protein AAHC03_0283 [Spirometra sp. Aus1]